MESDVFAVHMCVDVWCTIYICPCVCACMCVCVYIYIHIYMYTHISMDVWEMCEYIYINWLWEKYNIAAIVHIYWHSKKYSIVVAVLLGKLSDFVVLRNFKISTTHHEYKTDSENDFRWIHYNSCKRAGPGETHPHTYQRHSNTQIPPCISILHTQCTDTHLHAR